MHKRLFIYYQTKVTLVSLRQTDRQVEEIDRAMNLLSRCYRFLDYFVHTKKVPRILCAALLIN